MNEELFDKYVKQAVRDGDVRESLPKSRERRQHEVEAHARYWRQLFNPAAS